MGQLFVLPKALSLNSSVQVQAGALANFYLTGTTTRTDTYQDADLTTPHANPVVADAAGVLPPIWLDSQVEYKLTLTTAAAALIYTVDPVNPFLLTQEDIGVFLYPRTAAEISAGVTPTNYAYPPGDVRRYGAICDNSTDSLAAFNSAREQHNSGGAHVLIVMEGSGYRLSGVWTLDTSNTRVETVGRPLIRSTDNTAAVIFFDGGAAGGGIFRCYLGDCLLDGGVYGLRVRACHRSEFHAAFRNIVTDGLRTEWAVLCDFCVRTSDNDDSGQSPVMAVGCHLLARGSDATTACTFIRPIMENIPLGFDLEAADNCLVLGGTSEGNSTGGVRVRSGSDGNTFVNHYCELNGTTGSHYDFRIAANYTKLIGCTLASGGSVLSLWVENGARGTSMEGGFVTNYQIDSGANRTRLIGVRRDSGITTNNGTATMLVWIDADGADFPNSRMEYLGASVPTLAGTWANTGGGNKSAGFFRDPFNIVRVEGTVGGGGSGTTIFTLDPGFRPASAQRFAVPGGSTTTDIVVIEVQADGDVVHIAGATTAVALDSIAFLAA